MGAFIITREGCKRTLFNQTSALVGTVVLDSLHLFTNDIEPSFDTVTGDLAECIYAGYSPVTLDFSAAVVDDLADAVEMGIAGITFTFTAYVGAPKVIVGTFILSDGGEVTCVKALTTPYVIPNAGGSLVVTPKFRQRNRV